MCAPPAVPWQCLGVRLQQRTAPFERAQRSVLHVGAVHPCQLSASGAWDGLPLALARGSKLGEGHRKTCTGPALRIRSKSAYVCRVSLRLTTTRPARQRWAAAESRSFERCVPTTSCRDRAPASSIPLRAHGPPAARICTSATAMRTRCGEGDLVGGWHAGASPFTPITRWVTNRGSSSASFAHAYTPLGRSQRL